jgi:hypothetical protein
MTYVEHAGCLAIAVSVSIAGGRMLGCNPAKTSSDGVAKAGKPTPNDSAGGRQSSASVPARIGTNAWKSSSQNVPKAADIASASTIVASPRMPLPSSRIEYFVKENIFEFGALHAKENGKTYQLIDKSLEKCLSVIDQRDFDNNGLVDALVAHITACGGNCCGDEFFFVSAFGDGHFEISENFVDSWWTPAVEKWRNRWSVVISSDNVGCNTDRPQEVTRRFILVAGKAIKVEERWRKDMKSIVDMRSEIFDGNNEDETHSIEFDLDGDGKKDQISGKLWWRWGVIMWTVRFAGGKEFSSDMSCKRIGVLSSKTNGINDLVCGQDSVLRWNGVEYK